MPTGLDTKHTLSLYLSLPLSPCSLSRVCVSLSLPHHEEGEVAIAEQVEDHERQREEAKPQQDIHVLFSNRAQDPAAFGAR